MCLVGSPGVGKSRLLREVAALATRRGAEVHWTFCESHQRGVPYRVAARLLQSVIGVAGRDGGQDRTRVREFLPDADPQDLVLLDDLLGIANAEVPSPTVDPDARRRRLTALCWAALFAPNRPALYLVEDVHWIDESSQAMLTDLLVAVEQTRTMVLISSRPERDGALPWLPRARTLALSPLHDSDIGALLAELLGTDSSVGGAAALITARAAGNPFFAEEMVRELVQCGTLQGRSGNYVCHKDIDGIAVPPTVQAVIAARIDRLDDRAKRTLNAAAVIGERVDAQLLADVGVEPEFDELIRAELVDPVRLAEGAGYVFRHPLIRAVAYESQLRSSRAELHRRLAAAIEACGPESADQNAALIAEHLRAAGEPRTAYAWYMRAGAWAANRDIAAAGISWGRAHAIADELPADDPDRAAMCIAPLSMLCGTAWRVQTDIAGRFEELRRLCTLSGDKAALAVGMAGIVTANLFDGHVSEAARRAAEQMALLESIGEPELTIGAGFMAVLVKYHVGYIDDVLRWAQAVIDWADGDPARGGLIVGSPLALALVWRGLCRCWLGVAGWRQDLDDAVALARGTDPATGAWVVIWKNQVATGYGVLLADDAVVRELEEVLLVAEQAGDDTAYGLVRYTLGVVLVSRGADDAERGMELIEQVRDMCVNRRFYRSELPVLDFTAALDIARRGDLDSAIPMLRAAVNQVFDEGRGLTYGVAGSAGLVETLLARGTDGDVREAQQALDRMANIPAAEGFALHKITLYRLRALLAATNGDDVASRDFVMQYRGMAAELGFEGHLAMAEAMTGG